MREREGEWERVERVTMGEMKGDWEWVTMCKYRKGEGG